MIEQQIIDGKKAMVAYINADLKPVDKDKATLVKAIFDDGTVVFLTPEKKS